MGWLPARALARALTGRGFLLLYYRLCASDSSSERRGRIQNTLGQSVSSWCACVTGEWEGGRESVGEAGRLWTAHEHGHGIGKVKVWKVDVGRISESVVLIEEVGT